MIASTLPVPQRPDAFGVLDDRQHAMLADLNRQLETALVVELAKLAPGDRRLFRAALYPVQTRLEDRDGTTYLVAECDPPKMWLVERHSDEDFMDPEHAAKLVKAGAGQCRFTTDDHAEPCPVALCDFHYPEAWV